MAPQAAESASPIGIANLPNQRHKIVAKRGAGFTIMVRISPRSDSICYPYSAKQYFLKLTKCARL
jgi:hypothetical protein